MLKKILAISFSGLILFYSSSTMSSETCDQQSDGCACPGPTCGIEQPEKGCLLEESGRDKIFVRCQQAGCGSAAIYSLPGSEPSHVSEGEFDAMANSTYPKWYRGCAEGGKSDQCSHHHYYTFIGPDVASPGVHAENILCGTYYMKPGATYPAHSHPAREFYYIMEGEADWYAGSQQFPVKPGSFIVHPPYTPHGWTNTSNSRWLEAFYCWWIEPGEHEGRNLGNLIDEWEAFLDELEQEIDQAIDQAIEQELGIEGSAKKSPQRKNALEKGGLLTNPCLSQSPKTALPYKEQLEACQ